ncbi:rRNA-binding ribosome biosynthesis protein rpf2 [Phlyctochytrium planicorne]|nr:rRNA-binding ribosome biosynthesis protein rpf2 [Phlyctochytrium planicorne]
MTIFRRCIHPKSYPDWVNLSSSTSDVQLFEDGTIEDSGSDFLRLDFANKIIGGGVLGHGAVQEEILFIINPDLIVTRLVTEVLDDNEALVIIGTERCSSYSGYASTFTWDGPYEDTAELDALGRKQNEIIAIDALYFMKPRSKQQFQRKAIVRELNKAYTGFLHSPFSCFDPSTPLATGCGAFNGDPELKFLIQLIAASAVKKNLVYFTFGDEEFANNATFLHRYLIDKNVTPGALFSQILLKAKSAAGKRILKKREPQVEEAAKVSLFLRGSTSSELGLDALKDLYQLKRPDAILFSKKNEIHPFDDPRKAEFLSEKNDATFMVLANHSKKRPHNIVFVRYFDHQILDMYELGIIRGLPQYAFESEKPAIGHRPVLLFQGHQFEIDETFKEMKNFFLDFFRGEEADRVNLKGLDLVISITVDSEKHIHIRCYTVALLKGEGKIPKVKLNECGPALEMELRRTRKPDESLWKHSLKVPKVLKPKVTKNIERDSMGDKVGRIHMEKQDMSKLQTRKMKGLKRTKKEEDGSEQADSGVGIDRPKKRKVSMD